MKKISYLLSVLFLLALTVFSGCKDDTPDETARDRANRQLTTGAFTVQTVTIEPGANYSFDGPTTIRFQNNGTFTITGGEALPYPQSGPTNPLPASGNWTLGSNNNTITLANGSSTVLNIITLADNELSFQYDGAEPKPTDEVTVTVNATR